MRSAARSVGVVLGLAGAWLAIAGCGGQLDGGAGGPAEQAGASALGHDAHPAHRGYAGRSGPEAAISRCATCHGARTALFRIDQAVVLAGGTSTDGGVVLHSDAGSTCTVACHFPFGAPPAPVQWSDVLTCTRCHTTLGKAGAGRRSSHDPIFSDVDPASGRLRPPALTVDPTWCWSCHSSAASRHAGGQVQLLGAAVRDQVCLGCHSGQGQTLRAAAGPGYVEKTAPVLPSWSLADAGDWHGARAGAGVGGTLRAPYARGQAALPCETCHAGHESGNPFLFAPAVNGAPVPPGAIERSGVGAEALCEACHLGDRHAVCKSCHTAALDPAGGFDPAAPPVDPMPPGSPCFFCHGHEGIRNWTPPGAGSMGVPPLGAECKHCHGMPRPGVNPGVAPVIRSGQLSANDAFMSTPSPQVYLLPSGTPYAITTTSATLWWETSPAATTWLEWGVGTAGTAVTTDYPRSDPAWGSPSRSAYHRVVLTGLSPGTTYVFRVRASDDYRNTVEGPLASFSTPAVDAPYAPVLVHHADLWGDVNGPATLPATLAWGAVTAPSGNPVQYRLQLSTDAAFAAAPLVDTGWVSALSVSVTVAAELWPLTHSYAWRVKARDGATQVESPWSVRDGFSAWLFDPNEP